MERVIERQTKNDRVRKGDRDTYIENDILYIIYRVRQTEREREREREGERNRERERERERQGGREIKRQRCQNRREKNRCIMRPK